MCGVTNDETDSNISWRRLLVAVGLESKLSVSLYLSHSLVFVTESFCVSVCLNSSVFSSVCPPACLLSACLPASLSLSLPLSLLSHFLHLSLSHPFSLCLCPSLSLLPAHLQMLSYLLWVEFFFLPLPLPIRYAYVFITFTDGLVDCD